MSNETGKCNCPELESDLLIFGEHFHDEEGNRIAPESVTRDPVAGLEEETSG